MHTDIHPPETIFTFSRNTLSLEIKSERLVARGFSLRKDVLEGRCSHFSSSAKSSICKGNTKGRPSGLRCQSNSERTRQIQRFWRKNCKFGWEREKCIARAAGSTTQKLPLLKPGFTRASTYQRIFLNCVVQKLYQSFICLGYSMIASNYWIVPLHSGAFWWLRQ